MIEIAGRDLIVAVQAAVILLGGGGALLERTSTNAEVDAEFAGLQALCENQLTSANEQITQCRAQLQECWEKKFSSHEEGGHDAG